MATFEDNIDLLSDLLALPIQTFREAYPNLDEQDIDNTIDMYFPFQEGETKDLSENEEIISNLAELMRKAENMHIDEMNGRPTGWQIKGEDLKGIITNIIEVLCTDQDKNKFYELIKASGI